MLKKLKEVTFATFFGIFATGICQGIVAGLIFFFLGINNAILWGTATAIMSVVPVLGTATVWVPISLYLVSSGAVTKGTILFVLGVTVIGLLDNLIRPLIIEGTSQGMHLLLVVFSLAGGLILFGPSGLVLGPLVAALFVTFLEIYKIEFEEQLATGAHPSVRIREEERKTHPYTVMAFVSPNFSHLLVTKRRKGRPDKAHGGTRFAGRAVRPDHCADAVEEV